MDGIFMKRRAGEGVNLAGMNTGLEETAAWQDGKKMMNMIVAEAVAVAEVHRVAVEEVLRQVVVAEATHHLEGGEILQAAVEEAARGVAVPVKEDLVLCPVKR
jgi:hypothetical protein